MVIVLEYKKGYRDINDIQRRNKSLIKCDTCGQERCVNKCQALRSKEDGHKCRSCVAILKYKNKKIPRKLTKENYDKIYKYTGYKLISNKIPLALEKGLWECNVCKNKWITNYNSIYMGKRCPKCLNIVKITEQNYHEIAKINGISYLGPFPKRTRFKTNWRCRCGEIFSRQYHFVRLGQIVCKKCRYQKISGKNSYMYNPNLTEDERVKHRGRGVDITWAKKVYKKYKNICQKCQQANNKLCAHHIYNFNKYPSLRYDVDNGICLCSKCHNIFHSKYDRKNNNVFQLEEFLDKEIDKKEIITKINILQNVK